MPLKTTGAKAIPIIMISYLIRRGAGGAMHKYVLFGALGLLIFTVYLKVRLEEHFMVESVPDDPIVKPAATKAYYNEMSNAEFERLLQETFPYPCYKLSVANDSAKWLERKVEDDGAKSVFKYLEAKINDNPAFKDPNLVESPPFQLVDYEVVGKWRHKFQPFLYKYDAKAVVYREGKYHGKALHFTALKSGSVVDIVQISVAGIVAEDRIALYPVSWNDPEAAPEAQDPLGPSDYQKMIFDNDEAQKIIDKHAIS